MSHMASLKFALFNTKRSSIYLIVKLYFLAKNILCITLYQAFHVSVLIKEQEQIGQKWCTICAHRDAYTLPIYSVSYTNINIYL